MLRFLAASLLTLAALALIVTADAEPEQQAVAKTAQTDAIVLVAD